MSEARTFSMHKATTSEEGRVLERRQMQLMERRNEMAVAGVRIEQMLRQTPETQLTEELAQQIAEELTHIDKRVQSMYYRAIRRFFYRKQATSLFCEALLQKYGPREGVDMRDPAVLGATYFRFEMGHEPLGVVRAYHHEGCLMVIVEDPGDVEALEGSAFGQAVGHAGPVKMAINGREYEFFLVMAYPDERASQEVILRHEFQHVINADFLSNANMDCDAPFSVVDRARSVRSDPTGPDRVRRAKYFRWIKDEALAFVREGEGVDDAMRDLLSCTYAHLYEAFPDPEEQKAVKKLTRDIVQSLATIRLWHAGPQGRALLVHLLYPIPFERLPEWIPVIRRFYKMHLPYPVGK